MKRILPFILFIIFIITVTKSNAATIGNGEIEIITIKSQYAGKLNVDGKIIPWIEHPLKDGYKIAIISASYYRKGEIKVRNSLDGGISTTIFHVVQRDYKKERLTISSSKMNPSKDIQKRIRKEKDEAMKIYSIFTNGVYFNNKFILPMDSHITSPFGTARLYNNQLRSYHGGVDFRASIGKEVIAANDGIVRIAKNRYLSGNSIVIDHGSGIYTQYFHLSKIFVKPGEIIKRGQIIGLSGKSGRVTGPHLHFGVMVNGMQVNPIEFTNKINAIFD